MSLNDAKIVNLPEIDADNRHLPEITKQAWDALLQANEPPYLFIYANNMVRLVKGDNGRVYFDHLDKNKLKYELARCANFYTTKNGAQEPALPPNHVVTDMLSDPNPPLLVLERIVNAPIFSENSQLHTRLGYCPLTKCYLNFSDASVIQDVPMFPSEAEITLAREIINEPLNDFPFISQAEKTHAISLYLSPFVRDMILGPVPIYIVEAPSPGTGKTLLALVLAYPATGSYLEAMSEGRNDEEMRKRITAKLMRSPTYVLIDNVRHQIDYSSLSSAITSTVWEDRVLGASRTARLRMKATWVITGNNPSLSSEISRRCVRIRMDTGQEQPWLRNPEGFKHQNLLGWVKENRTRLIWAGLVLVQNWISKGKPAPTNIPTMGMFEEWCRVMGGILEVNGISDFLGNLEDMYTESDREIALWRSFAEAWWKEFGESEIGTAELYSLVLGKDISIELCSGSERNQKISLGKQISKMRQRQFGNYRIVPGKQKNNSQTWRLEPVNNPL